MRNFKESPVEKYRIRSGPMSSPEGAQFGSFAIPMIKTPTAEEVRHPRTIALCLADDGAKTGWERVAVAVQVRVKKKGVRRLPTLEELDAVKSLFWAENETPALLLHAEDEQEMRQDAASVSLWKPRAASFALPPQAIL